MPGKRCTVAVCNNSHAKTKEDGVVYFNFPKDPEIRSKWVHLCKREGKWNPDSCSVCSDHFLPEDYERDLKSELLNLPSKKKLKQTAIPSQKLTKPQAGVNVTAENVLTPNRKSRYENRNKKQLVKSLLCPEKSQTYPSEQPQAESCELTKLTTESNLDTESISEKYALLLGENKILKAELLKKQYILREKSLKIRRLTNSLKALRKKNCRKSTESNIKDKLSTVFTKNQIDLLLGNKNRVNWTNEEISIALTLRYLGKRTYLYLQRKCRFPLPSLSTLNRWITNINIRKGFFDEIFRLMEVAGENKEKHEKAAVLTFDEMKVKATYEYDQKNDQVIGPHKQMQVIVLRGLFSNWKQPIFIDFDTTISKEIVFEAINRAHASGYTVVACVSDMGGGNYGLWKKLNVSIEKPWFENPAEKEKKVFLFADAPHVLKLLRNWFLDTGFLLEDNVYVDKTPIRALLQLDSNELKVCHKLNKQHLEVVGAERQNVRMAVQLFSNTTAKALVLYKPVNDENIISNLSAFISSVNDWFDIMNSYVPQQSLQSLKCGYGMYEVEQNKRLDDMFTIVKKMRCPGKKGMLPFQKGILLSINAVKGLLDNIRKEFQMNYILTHRLNQDTLENLFSQIRSRGGLNDHPTPLNAIHRIRMIIFGKNPGVVQNHMNTTDLSESEFIVANVLKKLDIKSMSEENQEEIRTPECPEIVEESKITECPELEEENQTTAESPDIVEGAQNYLAGWVAKKYLKKYPFLGDYTYKSESLPENKRSWIQHLSKGGLVEPSEQWLRISKVCEQEFKVFHGDDQLKKDPHVVKDLATKVSHKVGLQDIPLEVITSYIKMRTIIRMKDLNLNLETKIKKRKVDADTEERKRLNKFKKICT